MAAQLAGFQMKRCLFLVLGVSVLLATVCCSSNTGAKPKSRSYERGEVVTITGIVTDLANQPVEDLEVVLEAGRHSYDYLRFRKRRPVVREVSTTTSADGAFEIQWPWDRGFNRFALAFGVRVTEPGGERFHVLHREDLNRKIEHGSPVVANVQIEDTSFLDSFLEFRANLEGEAQREVYREVGKPDKVRERVSAHETFVDWWYFELGKVYRFRDGELQEIEKFEPVRPFDS
jgi:hypothetical protein